jgi:hypothetical protein
MDWVVIMLLGGGAFALVAFYWHLLVRPEVTLSLWDDNALSDESWSVEGGSALYVLRWVLGGLVFAVGFLTGLLLTYLSATGS